jgi:hypothetical protein
MKWLENKLDDWVSEGFDGLNIVIDGLKNCSFAWALEFIGECLVWMLMALIAVAMTPFAILNQLIGRNHD